MAFSFLEFPKYGLSHCTPCPNEPWSPLPVFNQSNVVYKIDCLNCDDFYIGMTRRRRHKRLKERETRQYSAVY